MISGKEAAAAWIDGIPVEVRYKGTMWFNLSFPNYGVDVFKSKNHEFRLKPRTITLNGIEVPAPFEPKEGEIFFFIYPPADAGYCSAKTIKLSKYLQFGAWRTEEEIKQVVEALRNVFNP